MGPGAQSEVILLGVLTGREGQVRIRVRASNETSGRHEHEICVYVMRADCARKDRARALAGSVFMAVEPGQSIVQEVQLDSNSMPREGVLRVQLEVAGGSVVYEALLRLREGVADVRAD